MGRQMDGSMAGQSTVDGSSLGGLTAVGDEASATTTLTFHKTGQSPR